MRTDVRPAPQHPPVRHVVVVVARTVFQEWRQHIVGTQVNRKPSLHAASAPAEGRAICWVPEGLPAVAPELDFSCHHCVGSTYCVHRAPTVCRHPELWDWTWISHPGASAQGADIVSVNTQGQQCPPAGLGAVREGSRKQLVSWGKMVQGEMAIGESLGNDWQGT